MVASSVFDGPLCCFLQTEGLPKLSAAATIMKRFQEMAAASMDYPHQYSLLGTTQIGPKKTKFVYYLILACF